MKRTEIIKVMKQRIEWGWTFNQVYDYLCELDQDKRCKKQRYFHEFYK